MHAALPPSPRTPTPALGPCPPPCHPVPVTAAAPLALRCAALRGPLSPHERLTYCQQVWELWVEVQAHDARLCVEAVLGVAGVLHAEHAHQAAGLGGG